MKQGKLAARLGSLRSSRPRRPPSCRVPARRPRRARARTPWARGAVPWASSPISLGAPDPPPPYRVEPAFPAAQIRAAGGAHGDPGSPACSSPSWAARSSRSPTTRRCEGRPRPRPRRARPGRRSSTGWRSTPNSRRTAGLPLLRHDGERARRHAASPGSQVEPDRPAPDRPGEREGAPAPGSPAGHNGGCLAFGPDGCLYISTGDARPTPRRPTRSTPGRTSATCSRSVLRIDVDHEDAGKAYRVPPDNPFVKPPGRPARDLGLRLPQPLADELRPRDRRPLGRRRRLGTLGDDLQGRARAATTAGASSRGRSRSTPTARRGPTPILPPDGRAPALRGGLDHRRLRLPRAAAPGAGGRLHLRRLPDRARSGACSHDGGKVTWHRELADTAAAARLVRRGRRRARSTLLDYERTQADLPARAEPGRGASRRRLPAQAEPRPACSPRRRDHTPAPGVIPYAINAELWSDDATAERLLAVPGTGADRGRPASGRWQAPGGLGARPDGLDGDGARASRRAGDGWRRRSSTSRTGAGGPTPTSGTTSRPTPRSPTPRGRAGPSRSTTRGAGGRPGAGRTGSRAGPNACSATTPGSRRRRPSSAGRSASPLALTPASSTARSGAGGSPRTRSARSTHLGLFASAPSAADPKALREAGRPLRRVGRPRRPGAVVPPGQLRPLPPVRGGGLGDDRPRRRPAAGEDQGGRRPADAGDVRHRRRPDHRPRRPGRLGPATTGWRSSAAAGCPGSAPTSVDERGLHMIGDWIAGLPRVQASRLPGRPSGRRRVSKTLRDPPRGPLRRRSGVRRSPPRRGALALLRLLERGASTREAWPRWPSLTREGPTTPEVRDLFERYVPDDRARQAAGRRGRPGAILALKGDAGRGGACSSRSRAPSARPATGSDGQAASLGPDLSAVGSKYAEPDLLRHILEPSQAIEPNYVALRRWRRRRASSTPACSSRGPTGEVVLKDARRTRRSACPPPRSSRSGPQAKSLMPELLLRDMTPQQAADLAGVPRGPQGAGPLTTGRRLDSEELS